MVKRKSLRRLVTVIIMFSILMPGKYVQADEKPNVKITDGELKFTTIDKKASTTIRWKTVGFTICKQNTRGYPRQDTDGNTKTKDYATIKLDDDDKREVDIGDGKVEVTFWVNEEAINAALDKTSLGSIKDGDTIYLNGIFHVLRGDKEEKTDYYDWKGEHGIADALLPVTWAGGASDFQDHFNIPVEYNTTKKYPITIERWLYHSTGNVKYNYTDYTPQKKNTDFSTNNSKIQTSISESGETYYLYRVYYINLSDSKKKLGNKKIETNPYVSESAYHSDVAKLQNETYKVPWQGLKIVALYRKFVEPGETEVADEKQRDFEEYDPTAVLQADSRGNEAYDVLEGIPGTEALYANAFTNEYLSAYRFVKSAGKKMYQVNVTKNYRLEWVETITDTDVLGNTTTITIPHSQAVPVTKTYYVQRPYSYWSIDSLAVYGIDKAVIANECLPGGSVTLTPSGYSSPTVSYTHKDKEEDHITEPVAPGQLVNVTIPGVQTINGGSSQPGIPEESFQSNAEEKVGKIKCKNDKLIFKGVTIMSDEQKEDETAEPDVIPESTQIGQNVLYQSGLVIPAVTANAEYETEGTVIYKPIVEFNQDTDTEYDIEDINSVVVHTPTVCDAQVQTNIQDNQMINPDKGLASMVLDRSFMVKIPTEGNHRDILGYGYKDYAKYIANRQVKFPFDVYSGNSTNGMFIPAGNWINVSREETQFYLPTWVQEGKYMVNFQSIAINSDANNGRSQTETMANLDLSNYVATDTVMVEVSGRIYGLNLYDISDYPIWEKVFRSLGSLKLSGFKYTVGTKDQNGNSNGQDGKYTLALVNGSHPDYNNIGAIKTGYVTRFSLKTVGTMNGEKDYIRIKPTFYYVDSTGKNRKEVDLYYSETINGQRKQMVKMGSDLDLTNRKALRTGDSYLTIPEGALKQTANYQEISLKDWKAQMKDIYTFTNIMLPGSLRTFVGYVANVPTGVSEQQIAESVQDWYGEYYLPSEIHVAPKGVDILEYVKNNGSINYKEPFWLKEGYVIVNFQIETLQNGVTHLSYINADNAKSGYCNMWKREGYQYKKVDYQGNEFNFIDGDYVLYYANKPASKDYITAGTH
ncbi:DUF5704 domain-containing protein [Anaerocolumna sp. AGMB13025]|uniref:DUF5704 domain-containing protein n=1 Tax=Anaerocolumna sp. AGMB13025 TaxID=3039116 RepID=UPI00241FAA58|nr:DUF5704 domain-containing protein [Anaerocolumna sp. AGMB13025]WFR58726.1 DUF5704 domain-containing protein [Anaerocolumna sp. AGMB13025]